MLALGPRARIAFAVLWLGGQAALVSTAGLRSDGIFGFRMFPEASTIEIHLARQVGGLFVPAPGGEWSARDAADQLRHFSWHDRVRDPILGTLDSRIFASYGTETQMARLQRALDDVADHLEGDDETTRLRADVELHKNAGAPVTVVLVSHARRGP